MTGDEGKAPQAPAEGSDQIPPPNPGSPRKPAADEDEGAKANLRRKS